MADILFTNFAHSRLAAGIGPTATSVLVETGHGARFPSPTGGDFFYVTLESAAAVREIVKVTGRVDDTLTVVRGQDNTTALDWAAGVVVALRLNAAAIEYVLNQAAATYTKSEIDAMKATFTGISVTAGTWTGTGPHTAVVTVTGMLATDRPIVDIDLSGVAFADVEAVQADWGLVYRVAATANNQLTLFATAAPTKNFTLTAKVVR